MILATLASGFALLLIQQAVIEYRRFTASFTELDHASKIFPHPNEQPRSFKNRT